LFALCDIMAIVALCMRSRIGHITFDCADPAGLAAFWGRITGFAVRAEDSTRPDDDEVLIVGPDLRLPGLLFIRVPEPKRGKNRVHVDLHSGDSDRDATVVEALNAGAVVVEDRRHADGTGWVVLADPEGNEFCIVRSDAERPGYTPPRHTGERPVAMVRTSDERTILTSVLDWYREGVLAKVQGLSDREAGARPLPSGTSISGLLKHLALVEDHWLGHRIGGLELSPHWSSVDFAADPDWEFRTGIDDGIEAVTAMYRDACLKSRVALGNRPLDELGIGTDSEGRPVTVRWVLVHLLEETARHLGHLDILRELLDGSTGE